MAANLLGDLIAVARVAAADAADAVLVGGRGYADTDALDYALHWAVAVINDERMAFPLGKLRISA